ncbi:ATPase [soil metagenome]
MEKTGGSYDILIGKLDEFIRKYYKNQLIRGLLYATGILVSGFLVLTVLEYFAHFDILVRTILFWSFILSTIAVLSRFVFFPVFKLNKIGKIISHDVAADIIGNHFANVQDKLLNVLQLRRAETEGGVSTALIHASIDQKISELKPVPFSAAIDLRQNKKYAKYALIPLLLIVIIIFTNAGIITESANRLAHPGEFFEINAPFKFEIQNANLKAVENEDFPLDVKMTGKEIPQNIFILIDGNEYPLNRESTIKFNYIFRNLQKSKSFRFFADGFTSKEYTLEVLPNPIVLNFDVELHYPKYTKKKDEILKNTGDLVVPAGTNIVWKFNTRATKNLLFALSDSTISLKPSGENAFSFSRRFLESRNYSLHTENEFLRSKDSIRYSINVIPDLYPAIAVDEKTDSTSRLKLYFTGEVKDDYGFSHLAFVYHALSKKDSTGKEIAEKTITVNMPVSNSLQRDQFYYFWDLAKIGVTAGDEIEYYFEVSDNDGVHGAKTTRSQKMIYHAPTEQELKDQNNSNNKKTEDELEASLAESQALQKDIDDMYKKLMEKKSLSWEDKKKIEDLKNRQKELQQKIDNVKQQQAQNAQQQAEFQPNDPESAAKQDEINKLFDQLATDDMKKMIAQMEALLQNADKDKMQKSLDDMKQENKDAQKDLDRTLNLFRDLQVQKKLDDAIKDLNKMQQQQDSLSKQSAEKNLSKEDQKENKAAQDSLNKKFDQFRKDMDALQEENQKLETPHDIPNTDLKEMEIQQQQREGSQNQNEGSPKKASDSQKKASDKMSELSSQLQTAQKSMNEEENAEDMQAIRQLLSNLIQLSFDQEALMEKVKSTSVNDPQYTSLAREQKKLRDDSKMIEDSLLALSKRNPKISPLVNKEITNINMNMDRAQSALGDRNTSEAQNREQQAMTSVNNLALMLNESLEQMMAQANAESKAQCSGGKCNKPGNGKKNKPGMSSLRSMQQGLNQQMKALQQSGKPGSAEQLAKMAAQQAYIRQMLQESMQKGKEGDGGPDPGGQTQSKMEETESDLVNKQITAETIKRQQDILDKMLEFEKAEQQKEMDEQRQSNEAKNQQESNPAGFSEYNSQKQKESELLKTVPPALNLFYKNKVNIYFNGVEQ